MLTRLETAADGFFDAWERSGAAAKSRERIEHGVTAALAGLRNLRSRIASRRDAARGHPALAARFRSRTGYELDLKAPASMNQKIQWRKVHDRNPVFPILADKVRCKEWVRERLGEDLTVPTLFTVRKAYDLPQDIASQRVVLKPNHASGRNLFVSPERGLSRNSIVRQMSRAILLDFGTDTGQWAYGEVPRLILAEPWISCPHGEGPIDLNFHMFGGRIGTVKYNRMVHSDGNRSIRIAEDLFLTAEWEALDVSGDRPRLDQAPPRPPGFDRMADAAERLSAGFDYLRVDFTLFGDRFYLGELTIYSWNGMKVLKPLSFDYDLGRLWTLPELGQRPA